MRREEEIALLLNISIKKALEVLDEMECSDLDFSECTQQEFNQAAQFAYQQIWEK